MADATRLLKQINAGDEQASDELFPLVYKELREIAARQLRSESSSHTLQPTDLVHEAYLRLVHRQQDSMIGAGNLKRCTLNRKTVASRLFLIVVSLIALSGWRNSTAARAEDRLVGIVWQVGAKGKDGKMKWRGRFRATADGKVWNLPKTSVPRVIGSWSGTEENTKMKIDKIGHPKNMKANGDYEFVLVGKDPKVWQGTFTQLRTGVRIPIVLRLVQD